MKKDEATLTNQLNTMKEIRQEVYDYDARNAAAGSLRQKDR